MSGTIPLTENARLVLQRRYLGRDVAGNVVESPEDLFRRVARCIAAVDARYDPAADTAQREEVYYAMMASLEFLPNSPTLMNAGTGSGQLSACFVLPVEDSIKGIFEAAGAMAAIHQTGGGTGFSFSRIRPRNDLVGSTGGVASGPVSFMGIFDHATEVVKQGGRRRGANMGVLRIDHPDIEEFIRVKRDGAGFRNFNLSVAVSDAFMEALAAQGEIALINPRDGSVAAKVAAVGLWRSIVESAWLCGDPGVVFVDRINSTQPTPLAGEIEATNPCGEQPLLPYESCNLGSINLSGLVRHGAIDWGRLKVLVTEGVRFLDNVIDANRYPLPQVREVTLANRKIGLGVMGFAEMLVLLGVPYASESALRHAEEIMQFIHEEAVAASVELGRIRGSFPNFAGSSWDRQGYEGIRNATLTTIAPTGTISIIAGTSSGIEPLFGLAFRRTVLEGTALVEVSRVFLEKAEQEGILNDHIRREVAAHGSVAVCSGVPDRLKDLFRTALEIEPAWHLRMQAAFQRHTDNGVSKTVNLPPSASAADVDEIYRAAYRLGCKGVTVFRYGSRPDQVLSLERMRESSCRVCRERG